MTSQPGEASEFPNKVSKLVSTIENQLRHDYTPPHVKRDAHAKMHGCVQATFRVDPDVPEHLRYGIFANLGRTYRAWVRFSNGFLLQHDLDFDTRGMAVKLLDVEGEKLADAEGDTQDFLLATYAAFFMPDVEEYPEFAAVTHRAAVPISVFFLKRRRLWRGLWALTRSQVVIAKSPLAIPYFSQTPYKLGPHVVKLQARPHLTGALTRSLPRTLLFLSKVLVVNLFLLPFAPGKRKQWVEGLCDRYIAPRDLLREAMMSFIAAHDASFDLLVQTQRDPEAMPIDDASVRWDEGLAPFRKVGTIDIPRQVFWPEPDMPEKLRVATGEMVELGENMSFNPWHALTDHEPLGEINRARRIVYPAISTFRHDANKVKRVAPTPAKYDELRLIVQHDPLGSERDGKGANR